MVTPQFLGQEIITVGAGLKKASGCVSIGETMFTLETSFSNMALGPVVSEAPDGLLNRQSHRP